MTVREHDKNGQSRDKRFLRQGQKLGSEELNYMLGTVYKAAYDDITLSKSKAAMAADLEERLAEQADNKFLWGMGRFMAIMRPVAAVCVVMLLLSLTALPVLARVSPAVYDIVMKYAPGLAEHIVYGESSDTSRGITMQVEAVNTEAVGNADDFGENRAELIVSFSDAEGSRENYIKGKVDMYDSYHLQSYGESVTLSGCHFLEYDEAEDKAYFRIQVFTDGSFDDSLLKLQVRQLLTECSEERRTIDLTNIVRNIPKKSVRLNGRGISVGKDELDAYLMKGDAANPRPGTRVLDFGETDEALLDTLSIVGMGYEEGILKIQSCRGDLTDGDRHLELFLVDAEGNERHEDYSVDWKQEVGERKASFTEHWFLVEEAELEALEMYGIFCITSGCVKGDWQVMVEL